MGLKEDIEALVKKHLKQADSFEGGKDSVKYSGPHFDENEYVAAIETLLSGWLIFGEKSREFEKEFAKQTGHKMGVLTNSGSSANLLMVSALSSRKKMNKWYLAPGSKIITPVVCFPTTINPIIQNRYTPVFVDVELPNLNLDLKQVREQCERHKGTDSPIRAILFAHVLGNPPDMDELMDIVKEYGLILLEDCCDALGSTYKGKKLGTFGLMSTTSFFPAHHMTMGEGGFVSTSQQRLKTILNSFRDWGRACYCNERKPGDVTNGTACGNRFKNWLPGLPEAVYDHRYVFDEIGYNIKPLDLQAAMGLEQIKKLPEMDKARRENFDRLKAIFSKYSHYFHLPEATPGSDPCWFGFLLTVKDGAPFSKSDIVNFLESKKIQTRSYFTGNALAHPAYLHLQEELGQFVSEFPVANFATCNTFFLGTFIGITPGMMDYIEKCVDEFMKNPQGTLQDSCGNCTECSCK